MNILIPLAGDGKRFYNEGYHTPKPLIQVLGKPLIIRVLESLNVGPDDNVYIIHQQKIADFRLADIVKRNIDRFDPIYIPIDGSTRGAAETVLLSECRILDVTAPTLIIDGDNIYNTDVISLFRQNPVNTIFYFHDETPTPIYSYISLDSAGYVTDIVEKRKISNNACIGVYGFQSGELLYEHCRQAIQGGYISHNEFYMSGVVKSVIQSGLSAIGKEANEWCCLGTPDQLRVWAESNTPGAEKKRFVFDLDGTLVSFPEIPGDYTTCKPIKKSISFLNFLKSIGQYIIVYTARRMKTHNGNIEAVENDIGNLTRKQLSDFGIEYDELIFGKPWGHFYIDDLCVSPSFDLSHQTGFYDQSTIGPRLGHKIEYNANSIRKYAQPPIIQNEVYWYTTIPQCLSYYVPKLLGYDNNYIDLERINGVPMSLPLLSGSLTVESLHKLLDTLDMFHQNVPDTDIPLYDNYLPKMKTRFAQLSSGISHLAGDLYYKLHDWLKSYNTGIPGIIHGDPVFTNILITNTGRIILIDPRGSLGGSKSIYGDIYYDYAKIYQSLCGYDALLLNLPIPDTTQFKRILLDRSGTNRSAVPKLASCLVLSMLPLHAIDTHKMFIDLAQRIYDEQV